MTLVIEGATYYQTHEVAGAVGVAKGTLLRWIREKRVADAAWRDRNGWRCFDKDELNAIKRFANRLRKGDR